MYVLIPFYDLMCNPKQFVFGVADYISESTLLSHNCFT